jgi:hypothetical protein
VLEILDSTCEDAGCEQANVAPDARQASSTPMPNMPAFIEIAPPYLSNHADRSLVVRTMIGQKDCAD